MMPAAKHGDPQLGIDIHLCTTPPSPAPTPLPVPHLSIVFDPFDYLPIIGATVTICGMKRATAGTGGIAIHIPVGFPFAPKFPDKDDELFMGSSTVLVDGEPFSYLALPVLTCQMIGIASPPRLRKKGGLKLAVLPTTFNLAIPTSVFVGGMPTISLSALAMRSAFAAFGKLGKLKRLKNLGERFKKLRQKAFKNMKPGFLKCNVLRAEPVNILSGEVWVEQSDFSLGARIPLEWVRTYASHSRRRGACGVGWESPADARLEIDRQDGSVTFIHPTDGPAVFPQLPEQCGAQHAVLELMNGARLSEHDHAWRVQTKSDLVYHFPKSLVIANATGSAEEVPLGRISDLCGNWLLFERAEGVLKSIRDSSERYIRISQLNGHITALSLFAPETGFDHLFVEYQYDAAGNLVTVVDALGNPYRFAYDGHDMVRHTNRTGLSFYYEYDQGPEQRRAVHAWGDGGLFDYRFEYWPQIRETRIINSLGHVFSVQCAEHGLPTLEIDPLGGRTVYEYDEAGRTTAVMDAANLRTEYAYDERGNLVRLTRPDGTAITFEIDSNNKPVAITDPNGATWRHTWDERGLMLSQTSPLGATTVLQYHANGLPFTATDARGATTQFGLDRHGNLISITDALGHITRLQRDELGNVLAQTDPLGRTTRYEYDRKGRLIEVLSPAEARTRFAYDAEDNVVEFKDEGGALTRFEYFGQGAVKKRYQPDGHVLEYHYDTEEQLIAITNQRGEHYKLRRDALGRVIEEVDYWGQATTYRFDLIGRLQQSVDPLGRVVQFTTDALGRARRKAFAHPDQPDRLFVETFDFDAKGNLLGCANEHVRIQRQYDAEGRLIEERQGDFVVRNSYDVLGNRLKRETSHGNTILYAYDRLGRVESIRVNENAPILIERDAAAQVCKETLGQALERNYQYDVTARLTAQGMSCDGEALFQTQYEYDTAGNLTQRRDSERGVDRYSYDRLGQIVQHIDPQNNIKRYVQDATGNRLYTHVLEQSEEWKRDGYCGSVYFRFDQAGNLVERRDQERAEIGSVHLEWNSDQRLIRSITNGAETRYRYDPLGRRIAKQTNGRETRFHWDELAMVSEQSDGASELIFLPGTFEPLALIRDADGGKNSYYYSDEPNGCPNRLYDAAGQLAWSGKIDTWGHCETDVENVPNPLRFQGQYADPETGLHYNLSRYYDAAAIGGFVSKDRLGLIAGANLYRYAPNPLSWIDPYGANCRRRLRRRSLRAIWTDPNHPLRFLLARDRAGTALRRFRSPPRRFHHILVHGPYIEAGHLTSGWSGLPERLAVQEAWLNQLDNLTTEMPHIGGIIDRTAVDIGGVPVETRTAQMWEQEGYLPPGTVANAPAHSGWT